MQISRRHFLNTGISLFSLGFAHASNVSPAKRNGLSILQGVTTSSSAEFSILVDSNFSGKVYARNRFLSAPVFPSHFLDPNIPFTSHKMLKVVFENLEGQNWEIFIEDSKGRVLDRRQFFLTNTEKLSGHISFGSCADDMIKRPNIWKTLEQQRPDVFFFIGDTVYADRESNGVQGIADPPQLANRYLESRLALELYYLNPLVPTLALWDDHDFGMDNGNRNYLHKEKAKEIFDLFFAQSFENENFIKGPGISGLYRAFGQNFFLLDNRTFKGPSGRPQSPYFDKAIETWLFANLNNNSVPSWLMAGSQWFTNYSIGESMLKDHPAAHANLMRDLKKSQSKVVFVSGDVHYSELMRIEAPWLGYESREITSSALHSRNYGGHKRENPRRLAATGSYNFTSCKTEITPHKWRINTRSIGEDGRTLYEETNFEVNLE